jgi:choline-sulfatase
MNTEDKYLRAGRAGYLGNLAFVDTCIGEVYSELERLGLIDNTIVVYTSDHGEMDGDHGLYQKFCLFEPSVRVPLIISWPGHIPEDRVTEALTEYFGIYPTLVEMTDTPMAEEAALIDIPGSPESIDSDSFANVLRNPDLAGPSAVFCEYALKSAIPQYMIRTRRYKYNFNHGTMHELYDLEADPGEYANLINDPGMKKTADDLRDQFIAWYDPEKNPYRNRRTG